MLQAVMNLFQGTLVQKQATIESHNDSYVMAMKAAKEAAEWQLAYFIKLQANQFVCKTENAKNILKAQSLLRYIEETILNAGEKEVK